MKYRILIMMILAVLCLSYACSDKGEDVIPTSTPTPTPVQGGNLPLPTPTPAVEPESTTPVPTPTSTTNIVFKSLTDDTELSTLSCQTGSASCGFKVVVANPPTGIIKQVVGDANCVNCMADQNNWDNFQLKTNMGAYSTTFTFTVLEGQVEKASKNIVVNVTTNPVQPSTTATTTTLASPNGRMSSDGGTLTCYLNETNCKITPQLLNPPSSTKTVVRGAGTCAVTDNWSGELVAGTVDTTRTDVTIGTSTACTKILTFELLSGSQILAQTTVKVVVKSMFSGINIILLSQDAQDNCRIDPGDKGSNQDNVVCHIVSNPIKPPNFQIKAVVETNPTPTTITSFDVKPLGTKGVSPPVVYAEWATTSDKTQGILSILDGAPNPYAVTLSAKNAVDDSVSWAITLQSVR